MSWTRTAVPEREHAGIHYVHGIPRKHAPRPVGGGRNRWLDHVLDEYRAARAAWELECELHTLGYSTEELEFRATSPAPTFKAFLIGMGQS